MGDNNGTKQQIHQRNGIIPVLEIDIDDVDVPPKIPCTTNFDIFLIAFSILMHIVDAVIDVSLAVRYLILNKINYFVWTTAFIFIPSLINFIVSRKMQTQDQKLNSNAAEDSKCAQSMLHKKVYCILIVLLQLAPVIRYYRTLKYALKARRFEKMEDRSSQRRYYVKMLKEDQDVALLRIFECFIEAAPQQVLQLTIILGDYHNSINLEFVHQIISILSSLGSMGWAMASYNRSIRLAQYDKFNIGVTGMCLQFVWHFGVTVSRIISVSVMASMWPLYTGIACLCHWISMSVWLIIDSKGILEFCRNYNRALHSPPAIKERICSMLFALVIGAVHVFIYLNAIDSNTLLKYTLFYTLCFLENIAACALWNHASSTMVKDSWYFHVFSVLCTAPFVLGVIAMITYYTIFHPSQKRKGVNTPS